MPINKGRVEIVRIPLLNRVKLAIYGFDSSIIWKLMMLLSLCKLSIQSLIDFEVSVCNRILVKSKSQSN